MVNSDGTKFPKRSSNFMKLYSAALYGCTSFFIMVVNKVVLTSYEFPSPISLGLGQMMATIVVLLSLKNLSIVDFPPLSMNVVSKVFPLPIFYVGNLISGFIGTKRLNLPMFSVLRRFSIVMTLIAEFYILNIRAPFSITMTVVAMITGSLIAAADDLGFDLEGYTSVLLNDIFTAANGVYSKKKLNAKELGKYGLLFYNTLIMIVPVAFIAALTGDLERSIQFSGWNDFGFIFYFLASCFMGFVLMYSCLLCTAHNSALTTSIVGCLKNIMTTYVGMYIGGDYIFSTSNFIGLNISMVASIVYSYLTFVKVQNSQKSSPSKDKMLLIQPTELKIDVKSYDERLR